MIGIFDSGIGGLSILSELIKIMLNEDYLFYEDSINNPYGEKDDEELYQIASNIVDYLLKNNCKIIVIACNTMTTSSMKKLKEKYNNTIFVGTVPAIKVAYDRNFKKSILMATPYTIKSNRVNELIHDYVSSDHSLKLVSCKNLANLIEKNDTEKIDLLLDDLLKKYDGVVDSVILGCTHYPLIKDRIKRVLPNCSIIDGSFGVAKEVYNQLNINNLLSTKEKGNVIIENSKNKELVDRSYQILKDMLK